MLKDFGKIVDDILQEKQHIVVIGATRSGKTTTVHEILARAILRYHRVYVLDRFGEYTIPLPSVEPVIPFRYDIIESIPSIFRPESGGTEISAVIYETLCLLPKSWSEFIQLIKARMKMKYEYSRGCSAVLSRIIPLFVEGVLIDKNIPLPPSAIIDLSLLSEETKNTFIQLFLNWVFEEAKKESFLRCEEDTLIVIEETRNIHTGYGVTPSIIPRLNDIAKFNIRLVLIYQDLPRLDDFNRTLRQQVLLVHQLNEVADDYYKLYGFPQEVLKLKKPEVLVFLPNKMKWKLSKVIPRFKPRLKPKISRTRPLRQLPYLNASLNEIDLQFSNISLDLEKRLKDLEARLNKIENTLNNIKHNNSESNDVKEGIVFSSKLNEKLRVLAYRLERLEQRIAADASTFERIFDFMESYESRLKELDKRLSRLESVLRKVVDYLEYREQLRSMRGEEV
ncbi:MAG: hypothetical protein DRJ52_08460 [Thermoprotei archaeon]|nr:MAG: hypothetical protein DRJ52_08460 [Thermoprotei archaeon]